MNKHIITGIFISLIIHSSTAQVSADSTRYAVVVQFHSICCGVPDEAPLKVFIKTFKKQNKIKKIMALHIGPMGREGEYYLAFSLKELADQKRIVFIRKIKSVAKKMKDKGNATVEEHMAISDESLPGRATIEKVIF